MPNLKVRSLVFGAALALAALGCGESGGGGDRILVTVDSNIPPDADPHLTEVLIEVTGGEQPETSMADLEGDPLPRQLVLAYGGGSRGPFTVTAVGTLSDGDMITDGTDVSFDSGKTVEVELRLDSMAPPVDGGGDGGGTTGDSGMEGGTTNDGGGSDAMVDGQMGDAGDAGLAWCDLPDGGTKDCSALDVDCKMGVCSNAMMACTEAPRVDGTACQTDNRCVVGNCVTPEVCGANTTCNNLGCTGNDRCYFDCTAADGCGMDCRGRACTIDCRGGANCPNVDCLNAAGIEGCVLFCDMDAGDTCGFGTCQNENVITCPSGVRICGGSWGCSDFE